MFNKVFESVGLSEKEAVIYDLLVQNGAMGIKELIKKAERIKRANLYALLYALKGKGLVEEFEERGKKKFRPASPAKLMELAEAEEIRRTHAREELQNVLPDAVSQFNLATGRPGVQFYEGREGVRRVLKASLAAESEIYEYVDSDAIERSFPEEDREHRDARAKLGVKKKLIAIDTPDTRKFAKEIDPALTELRLLPKETKPFAAMVLIYDTTVAIITVPPRLARSSGEAGTRDSPISIVIKDPAIAELHKRIFEFTWTHAAQGASAPSSLSPAAKSA